MEHMNLLYGQGELSIPVAAAAFQNSSAVEEESSEPEDPGTCSSGMRADHRSAKMSLAAMLSCNA